MSETGNMAAEDLEKLVEPMLAMNKLVQKDEVAVVLVFKATGEMGIVSNMPYNLVLACITQWVARRLMEMADGTHATFAEGSHKNPPQA